MTIVFNKDNLGNICSLYHNVRQRSAVWLCCRCLARVNVFCARQSFEAENCPPVSGQSWLGYLMINCFQILKMITAKNKNSPCAGAVPPTTKLSSLARRFSRYGAAMSYTDLLGTVAASLSLFGTEKISLECR